MWLLAISVLVLAGVFALIPSIAHADADDDIPGVPMSIGQAVQGVVYATTDPNDVYAIFLYEGQQVHIIASDTEARQNVRVYLHPPGSVSLGAVTSGEILFFNSNDGCRYMPAVTGTYYVRVRTFGHGVPYTLKVVPGPDPHITTPDSNDIPGIPMGNGSWAGVVDDVTDKNDVYAITLIAGQEMTITAKNTSDRGYARVSLYPPGFLSLRDAMYRELFFFNADGGKRYTPATSGTYHLRVWAWGVGVSHTITLSGVGPAPVFPLFSDGTFRPTNLVVRQQFAKMIVLSLNLPVSESDHCSFADVDRSGPSSLYPDNYVAVAASKGITRGTSSTAFSPWANIRAAEYNGLLTGITLAGWNVWSNASCGEVAQTLWNLTRVAGS
jgi:hypothetical protein